MHDFHTITEHASAFVSHEGNVDVILFVLGIFIVVWCSSIVIFAIYKSTVSRSSILHIVGVSFGKGLAIAMLLDEKMLAKKSPFTDREHG